VEAELIRGIRLKKNNRKFQLNNMQNIWSKNLIALIDNPGHKSKSRNLITCPGAREAFIIKRDAKVQTG